MFQATMMQLIDLNEPLLKLADAIPWAQIEQQFAKYYSHTGAPAIPIRTMVGLILLKQIENLSDEKVINYWRLSPYFQYFTGEAEFQWKQPCDPSDLVHFRKRIGVEGMELLLKMSVELHQNHEAGQKGKKAKKLKVEEVIVDTTVQEKNITYPTDTKLYNKIIKKVQRIASDVGVRLRQSYTRTVKKLNTSLRFGKSKVKAIKNQATKAQSRLKTIAGRLVRDLERKLEEELKEKYQEFFETAKQILTQKRKDKNKVYSLHEPKVSCISKGKERNKFEFGSKVSIVLSREGNVVLGVKSYKGNPYDGKTLASSLEQVERLTGKEIEKVIADRGYRGSIKVGKAEVLTPKNTKSISKQEAKKKRKTFRRRSAIEGVISQMKRQYGLSRNYLKGELGDGMNCLLSGIGFNLGSYLRKLAKGVENIFLFYTKALLRMVLGAIYQPANQA